VLGPVCSFGLDQTLPVYQAAGLVTLSGSATADSLTSSGYYAFNRTTVADADDFMGWYATVSTLPSELLWRQTYETSFGAAPMPFADLYYDAAALLIRGVKRASHVEHGSLVIDRTALMDFVRSTRGFAGVSCTITIDGRTGNRVNDPAALNRCAAQDTEETQDG
jgi:ABC-type branched-subunit amino acid transport system substrate-binding protein